MALCSVLDCPHARSRWYADTSNELFASCGQHEKPEREPLDSTICSKRSVPDDCTVVEKTPRKNASSQTAEHPVIPHPSVEEDSDSSDAVVSHPFNSDVEDDDNIWNGYDTEECDLEVSRIFDQCRGSDDCGDTIDIGATVEGS